MTRHFVTERFTLSPSVCDELKSMLPDWGYDQFSEVVFYRTYSRVKSDGTMEDWADVIIRVTEGVFSIRKDWYLKNSITWDEDFWSTYAANFAISMFKMCWLPPGRGLWAMGTDFIYERGSMALNNCGFITVGDNIGECAHWIMDALMCGVGIGFEPVRNDDFQTYWPMKNHKHIIPDSREGWCDSVKELIDCFLYPNRSKPIFDYSLVRRAGLPINGFGGISSGPEPLILLHQRIETFFEMYLTEDWYDTILLKADIINCIGCCVVAGNVRRSAEICCGSIEDETFLNLKNIDKYPYRAAWMWMSNNSANLDCDTHFEMLGEISTRVKSNGEPGLINRMNMKFGRIGKSMDGLKYDAATGFNPCGEQPLESKELCTLVETLPTRCKSENEWLKACEYATVYASTVTLLPTHRSDTNAVMVRNRRIGVGIVDFSGWKHEVGLNKVIKQLRTGYNIVRSINHWVNSEAGIPDSIRVTTVKPGGTIPKLAGKTSGLGHPNFHHTLRRMRIAVNSPMVPLLIEAGIPYELDVVSEGTYVFEFPIIQGPAKPATEVTLWEQAANLVVMQREWSDNAVSNTLNFIPKWELIFSKDVNEILVDEYMRLFNETKINLRLHVEKNIPFAQTNKHKIEIINGYVNIYLHNMNHEEDEIEHVLAAHAPSIKSISLLPQMSRGVYAQMPEQGISVKEYSERLKAIKPIDWSRLRHSIAEPDKYCTGEACEIKR